MTLSGEGEAIESLEPELSQRGIFARILPVVYAFHSRQMEPVKDDLLASLGEMPARVPAVRLVSTVTGRPAAPGDYGREYWWRNVRERVRFSDAIEDLIGEEFTVFLEISPHPVLAASVTETVLRRDHKAWVLSTLRRKDSDHAAMASTLGALQALGAKLDWDTLYPGPAAPVLFPKYAWSHEPFWHQTEGNKAYLIGGGGNPLLGTRRDEPADSWENEVNVWMEPVSSPTTASRNMSLFPGPRSSRWAWRRPGRSAARAP